MIKLKYMASVALAAMAIYSCDDSPSSIGNSLTDEGDKLDLKPATFDVETRTVVADSVFTLSSKCYLGRVRDPETQADVKSEFTTQFHVTELLKGYLDGCEVVSTRDGEIVADSCEVLLYLSKPFDSKDSLEALKMQISEMAIPVQEGRRYYSNFSPRQTGMLRSGGLSKSKMFSYANLLALDSLRARAGYTQNIRIRLDEAYTDREGHTYDNYGSYLLTQLARHPEKYRNSFAFTQEVCPGLFFEITDGLGFHTQISNMGIRVYYRIRPVGSDSVSNAYFTVGGTQEVLQTTLVSNDREAISRLAAETQHTYLKSPAGLFTEVTLPVEAIKRGHDNDSLLAASITFQRINNQSSDRRMFGIPSNILMVQADSLKTFFEKTKNADGRTTFLASYGGGTSKNVYAFTNISNLITILWRHYLDGTAKNPNWVAEHPNWNKVLLVPVTSSASGIEHDMSLTSTRLVGGHDNPNDPVQISVVYAKFTEKH